MKISHLLFALGAAALLLGAPSLQAQKKKSKVENLQGLKGNTNYEVETVGVGSQGTKSLKVWAYAKKVDDGVQMAKKCAVAACIFRGLPAGDKVLATPPLCENPDPKWDAFFEEFFAGGEYLNYVNLTSDGVPSGQDRLKTKKGYKVGVYVQVLHDRLRKRLEQEGVIQNMNSWF